MPITETIEYDIVCDYPGCYESEGPYGSEGQANAEAQREDSKWRYDVTTNKYYCEKHIQKDQHQ